MIIKPTVLLVAMFLCTLAFAQSGDHSSQIADFARWAHAAKIDKSRPGGALDDTMFKACLRAYDDAINAGVPASEPIKTGDLVGSMVEIRDAYCTSGKAEFAAKDERQTGPFKKVLRNDKLATWKQYSAALILPNGANAADPNKLASSAVWYVDTSPSRQCKDGSQVHVVHRYEFNGDHKLIKTSDQEFCGRPPASAYR